MKHNRIECIEPSLLMLDLSSHYCTLVKFILSRKADALLPVGHSFRTPAFFKVYI